MTFPREGSFTSSHFFSKDVRGKEGPWGPCDPNTNQSSRQGASIAPAHDGASPRDHSPERRA